MSTRNGAFPCYRLLYYLFGLPRGKSVLLTWCHCLLVTHVPPGNQHVKKPKHATTPNRDPHPSPCCTSQARSSPQQPRETPPPAERAKGLRTKEGQPFSQTPNSTKTWTQLSGIKAIVSAATINGEEPMVLKKLTLPPSRG